MTIRTYVERMLFIVERLITALLCPFYLLRESLGKEVCVPILMYHQVTRDTGGIRFTDDCVSPDRFDVQIRALRSAGYRVISLGRLVRSLRQGSLDTLRRCAVLTFDDGFRGQFVHAYPILQRYGLTATFFLISGFVGENRVYPHLALSDSGNGSAPAPSPSWRPLSWSEVQEMARAGMDVGSHSVSHRSLGGLDADALGLEVQRSRELLEQNLGVGVDLFAYPFGSEAYGDFNQAVREALRVAGYVGACTTVVGRNRPGTDPFALRRIPMEERDGDFRVRCKLAGAYDWVGSVKTRWQRLVRRQDRVDPTPLVAADGTRRAE